MPNLLVHFGVQGMVARRFLPREDLPWILAGCVIPDAAWILHRASRIADPGISPYDARLYAVVQSSLLFSCLLAAALASLARRPSRALVILAGGASAHLLLDALQTKLGNGVHLFSPLSWDLLNWGLFWPESAITLLLTAAGLVWILAVLVGPRPATLFRWTPARVLLGAVPAAAWLVLPLPLLPAAEASDTHFVKTLLERKERPGRPVAFDRVPYRPEPGGGVVVAWSGETLRVEGIQAGSPVTVSLRGRFVEPSLIRVSEHHVHWPWFRDAASSLALLALAVYTVRLFASNAVGSPGP